MAASASKDKKFRILLVDDHPIVRQGLAEMIDQQKDLQVCGTAEDVHKALEVLEKMKPDLVIADISLKGSNGIELLKKLVAERDDRQLRTQLIDVLVQVLRPARQRAAGLHERVKTAGR